MWDSFVELLRASIFSAAHLCGGSLGGGVLLVSAGLRLALLPLTLRMARRARQQQAGIAALRPQVEALQRRFANDPRALMRETQALYAANGIKLLTPSGLAGIAVQFPLLSGLFAAVRRGLGSKVRFLWVPDLARPDALLVLGVVAATALGGAVVVDAGSGAGNRVLAVRGSPIWSRRCRACVDLRSGEDAGSGVGVMEPDPSSRRRRTAARREPGAPPR